MTSKIVFIRTKFINTVENLYVWTEYKNYMFNEIMWTSF